MTNEPTYKLGRLPPVIDNRTLRLTSYLAPSLPPAPITVHWSDRVSSWPMYGNDAYGDCTEAAIAHMEQLWAAIRGKPKTPTTLSIINRYKRLTGCQAPGDQNDVGLNENTVLRDWRAHSIAGRKMLAWADIDLWNHDAVRQALYMFRGVYIGFGISDPQQLFSQFDANTPWTPQQGRVYEGHAVNIVDCDADTLTCISWARTQKLTWAFWDLMVDEAHCVLSSDEKANPPVGFDLAQLIADLAQIGHPGA